MKKGAELIADERKRQIEVEGWNAEHVAKYTHNELINAALVICLAQKSLMYSLMCYLQPESVRTYDRLCESKNPDNINIPPTLLPWDEIWRKQTPDNRIKELVKAGALIAAEIDRLQNANNS